MALGVFSPLFGVNLGKDGSFKALLIWVRHFILNKNIIIKLKKKKKKKKA